MRLCNAPICRSISVWPLSSFDTAPRSVNTTPASVQMPVTIVMASLMSRAKGSMTQGSGLGGVLGAAHPQRDTREDSGRDDGPDIGDQARAYLGHLGHDTCCDGSRQSENRYLRSAFHGRLLDPIRCSLQQQRHLDLADESHQRTTVQTVFETLQTLSSPVEPVGTSNENR